MEENLLGAEQARCGPDFWAICESASDEPESQVRYSHGWWSCSCASFRYWGACRHVDRAIMNSYQTSVKPLSPALTG